MDDAQPREPRPDVEAIVAEIRAAAAGDPAADGDADDSPWDALLREAGRLHRVGAVRGRGLRRAIRRLAYRVLGPLIEELNAVHGQQLRLMGELAREAEARARETESLRARLEKIEAAAGTERPDGRAGRPR